MSSEALSQPAYIFIQEGQERLGFFMGDDYQAAHARVEILDMLENLPDLAKGAKLEQEIRRFEKWQESPKFLKPKLSRKKRK